MFSRYSVACVRRSKKPFSIIDAILKTSISYFGQPQRFLADNGGEFINDEYRDMCEAFNIAVAKKQQETTMLTKRKFYRKLQPIHNRITPMNNTMTQIPKNKNCQLKKTFLIVKLAIKMTPQMKTVKLLL